MELNKRERHLLELRRLKVIVDKAIEEYLLDQSNLPGKRGNIELAFSFADYIEENYIIEDKLMLLDYCTKLISENKKEREVVGNEEFLTFCGIVALGRIGKIDKDQREEIIEILKTNAQDERWRVRESVAMAIQELLMSINPMETIRRLREWTREDNYLILRAVAAGLADPRLMENSEIAKESLDLHKLIITKIAENQCKMRDEDFKVLVKGLCYTLSVVITGIEGEGFAYLGELVKDKNPVIKKIAKENLKKNRLKRLNKNKVLELQKKMDSLK
jgi:hypothetical protein